MGFNDLPCILCLAEPGDFPMTLDLDDLETITCPECGETFTVEEIASLVGKWLPFLAWIEKAKALLDK
jgi:hypothetical protein